MNKTIIIVSAGTAFIIAAGGAMGVVLAGGSPTKWQVVAAIVLGLFVAAKDTRSLLKLPPVETETTETVRQSSDAQGNQMSEASKTVTTTPVAQTTESKTP
jgi:uncharacterized protein YneF (UPF0154 family)